MDGGLPQWATNIFGLVETHEQVDSMDDNMMEDEEVSAKEVIADSDPVIQLLENISLQDDLGMVTNEL